MCVVKDQKDSWDGREKVALALVVWGDDICFVLCRFEFHVSVWVLLLHSIVSLSCFCGCPTLCMFVNHGVTHQRGCNWKAHNK